MELSNVAKVYMKINDFDNKDLIKISVFFIIFVKFQINKIN